MKLKIPFSKTMVSLKRKKIKSGQKQLFRLGCAALALMLTVGAVPFLRGFAAESVATPTAMPLARNC